MWLRSGISVAVAAAPPQPLLAWELPYATGVALKKKAHIHTQKAKSDPFFTPDL